MRLWKQWRDDENCNDKVIAEKGTLTRRRSFRSRLVSLSSVVSDIQHKTNIHHCVSLGGLEESKGVSGSKDGREDHLDRSALFAWQVGSFIHLYKTHPTQGANAHIKDPKKADLESVERLLHLLLVSSCLQVDSLHHVVE